MRNRIVHWLQTALLFLLTVAIWEAVVRIFKIPLLFVPPPTAIVKALWVGASRGFLWSHIAYTLWETALGYVIGVVMGFLLGMLVAQVRWVERLLYPYVVAFQSLPKVALAPLIMVWLGTGLASKVVMAALVAFFPLLINVIAGLKSADEDRVSLLRSLDASSWQIFWLLRLPGSLPFVFAGLEVAMVFALIGSIVAEFAGATKGLGYLLTAYGYQMDTSGQFSILVVLALLGIGLSGALAAVRKRMLFWDPSAKDETPTIGT